jgi:hypothetical protein
MKINNLIKELLNKGFIISGVSLNDNELSFRLDGFYKSGDILLYEKDNHLFALARYDEITELDDENPFNSLVWLNFDWWDKSKDRYEGWNNPNSKWLPYLIEIGLIKEIVETKYIKK